MTLGIRKLVVVALVGGVFLIANFLMVANWLREKGVIDGAQSIRQEYLTGTAITIILVLLVLLVRPGHRLLSMASRCPVCDGRASSGAKYCSDCGSKL